VYSGHCLVVRPTTYSFNLPDPNVLMLTSYLLTSPLIYTIYNHNQDMIYILHMDMDMDNKILILYSI